MQVDSIKTRVDSAPGFWFQRLKLKYDELLSSFAFNFNWRRYTKKMCNTTVTNANIPVNSNYTLDELEGDMQNTTNTTEVKERCGVEINEARVKVTIDADVPGATADDPSVFTLNCDFEAKWPCYFGDAFTGTAVATARVKDFAMPRAELAGQWFCGLPKAQRWTPIMEMRAYTSDTWHITAEVALVDIDINIQVYNGEPVKQDNNTNTGNITSINTRYTFRGRLKGFITLTRHANAALGASYAHHPYGPDLRIVAWLGDGTDDREPAAAAAAAVASYDPGHRHLLGGKSKSDASAIQARLGSTYTTAESYPSTRIAIKIPGKYNKLCQVRDDDKIQCNNDATIGDWETFTIEPTGNPADGWVGLKSKRNDKYCADESNGIICNRDNIQGW